MTMMTYWQSLHRDTPSPIALLSLGQEISAMEHCRGKSRGGPMTPAGLLDEDRWGYLAVSSKRPIWLCQKPTRESRDNRGLVSIGKCSLHHMHSFSFSPPPVREAASSERLQKNARMVFVFREVGLLPVVNNCICGDSASSPISNVCAKSCLPFCWGRCKWCQGSHFRWLGRTYESPVWDSHWFHCLSLLVFVVQGFPGSIPVFHSKHIWWTGNPSSVHEAFYQSITNTLPFMIFLHHPGFSADCSE